MTLTWEWMAPFVGTAYGEPVIVVQVDVGFDVAMLEPVQPFTETVPSLLNVSQYDDLAEVA